MGITIHFSLKTSQPNVRVLIEQLHSAALDLSFEAVGEIIELVGEQCLHQSGDSEDLLITKIQAVAKIIEEGKIYRHQSDRIIGFTVYPGQGCEVLAIFLAHYPSLGGHWQSHSFCKTQFAIFQGISHFVTCHTAIISLLDKAAALNLLDESEESAVVDESGFWLHRDVERLVQNARLLEEVIRDYWM